MNKKRKKVSRARGSHTHGRGFKKKARGKGHRGGVGMAGTGKRGDQKKTLILKDKNYFGKVIRRGKPASVKLESINLRDVVLRVKNGEVNLAGYKVLGDGEIQEKIKVIASAFSKTAKEKIEKAGGEALVAE